MLLSLRRMASNMTGILSNAKNSVRDSTRAINGAFASASSTGFGPEDTGYEDAVRALHGLQSNAETIAKARLMREERRAHAIDRMNKYIFRSGLTEQEVDGLSVIHIAGTKGKGSTSAFCERILHFHGYKTGLFTSPHMVETRERIRINGRPISKEKFSKYFWPVHNQLKMTESDECPVSGEQMPAYFAFLTVLSLHVFIKEGVDVAVMEVGLGGQYDSTNFFRKPVVCGVTSLGFDHTSVLGNTIEEIAWNKAGIFKAGRPAITVQQQRGAMQVILDRAMENQSPLFVAEEMPKTVLEKYNFKLGIDGMKQIENASLAIQLYRMWKKTHIMGMPVPNISSPYTVDEITRLQVEDLDEATIRGLSSCEWPGRAQTIHREGITYYLDGAHTIESMHVCSIWFKEAADKEKHVLGGKVARIMIFNTTGERDIEALQVFLKHCDFDAAVFCPNVLSTVDSANRPDQLNRTVTPRWMMERVEMNKEYWDKLMTKETVASAESSQSESVTQNGVQSNIMMHDSSQSSGTVSPNSSQSKVTMQNNSQPGAMFCNQAGPTGDVRARPFDGIDYNYNNTVPKMAGGVRSCDLNGQVFMQNGDSKGDDCDEIPPKQPKTSHSTEILCPSDAPVQQNTVQVRCMSTIPSVINGFTAVLNTDSSNACTTSLGSSLTHPSSPTKRSFSDCSGEQALSDKQAQPSKSKLSIAFPCILQALAWATQGRDPRVKVADQSATLPTVPQVLSEARHLQIFVTGSLHLVGGVLGVINPEMND